MMEMLKIFKYRPIEVIERGLRNKRGEEIAVGSLGHDGGEGIPKEKEFYVVYRSRWRWLLFLGAVMYTLEIIFRWIYIGVNGIVVGGKFIRDLITAGF